MLFAAFIAGVAALVTALGAVPLVRKWALRGGMMDIPNERSSHAVPKPRTGGIGIVIGALTGIVIGLGASAAKTPAEVLYLVAIILALSAVGFSDDIWQLSAAKRMPLYLLGALLLAVFCFRIQSLDLLLVPPLQMGAVGGVVFTTLFIGWYANLFNFMDGIDGIAAGAAIVTCAALGLVFAREGNTPLLVVSASLVAATAGFLPYNYSPASIFMGDVGSVFLGAACGALTSAGVALGYLSIAAGTLLMFPFVFDATFTLFRRALRKEKVWLPHRSHIYQQMCDLGFSHRAVSGLYTGAAALFAIAGLFYDKASSLTQVLLVLVALSGGAVAGMVVLSRNRAKA